jgi:ELWxxDGT repeat protein
MTWIIDTTLSQKTIKKMDTNLGQVVLVQDINPGVSNNPIYPIDFDEQPLGEDETLSDEADKRSADSFDSIPRPYPGGASTPDSSFPNNLVEFNDQLYLSADNGKNGRELFVSDGTDQGTQLVKDLRPGASNYGYAYGSAPYNLVEFKDQLYFSANDGKNGNELFVSDGTGEGTQLLVDLRPGEDKYGNKYSSYASNLVEFQDKLYFTANDGKNGNELFVSDGTGEGTQLLADLRPGEDKYGNIQGSYPSNLVEFQDKLYFTANDGKHGNELFVSDGTAEETQLLVDLRPGEDKYGNLQGSYASNLVEFQDKLYFTANDGKHGNELFVSDGTAEGTQLLVDLRPGEDKYGNIQGSYPMNLVEANGKLYFTANDGEHGSELFVSDGTAEGTKLLMDLRPGEDKYGNKYGAYPSELVEFQDKFYFTANDGEHGSELFVSDGTAEGTQLVADIYPGTNNYGSPAGSYASSLTVLGDELFFAANDGETGTELFKLTFDGSGESSLVITGTDNPDNLSGANSSEEIQALGGQDTVKGAGGNDTIDGGEGDDNLAGNDGNDSLIGASGNDILNGGNGNDTLLGSEGSDVLNGKTGNDSLSGGEDNDVLRGGKGVDTLFGDNGDDRLIGLDGNDLLTGGNGSDRLSGGFGFDTLEGGAGEDVFALRSGGGSDTIVDFDLGSDRFALLGGLQFDDLSFTGNKIMFGEELLASLDGINAEQLSSTDFSAV